MISILQSLREGKALEHVKRNWGKYALAAGGVAGLAAGDEAVESGAKKIANAIIKGGGNRLYGLGALGAAGVLAARDGSRKKSDEIKSKIGG
jgi:hypothetical protein